MARGPSGPAYRLPFCSICPRHGARPSGPAYRLPFCSICSRYGSRPKLASLSLVVLPNLLPLWQAGRGPAYHCLPAEYTARLERVSLSLAVLPNLLPLWRAARAGQLIIALLLYIQRGLSGPPNHLRGPSGPPYHLRCSSGPVCHFPLCPMPALRRSPLGVKSAPRAGGRLIIQSRMVTHAVTSTPKTAKCACVANKVNAS